MSLISDVLIRFRKPRGLILPCAALLVTGCQFYKEKDSSEDPQLVSRQKSSYRLVMQNVIGARCIQCHANAFGTYDAIRRRISDIQEHALVKRDMPPNGPLSKTETKILQVWIDAGMPLNEGDAAQPVPEPVPLTPTFISIRDNVFTPRCETCHGKGQKHEDINIYDLATLTGADGWVVAYDPDKSELFQDLLKPGKGRMPPTKAGPGLTAEQIDTIRTWILNGAKD